MNLLTKIRLDIFGEGGTSGVSGGDAAAGSPSADATTTGVSARRSSAGHFIAEGSSAAENSEFLSADGSKTDAPTKSREERRRAYDEYIKGEGKEFYSEDTQKIISKRVKDHEQVKDKLSKLQPFIDALSDKYGHDPSDLEGLMAKISSDRDFYAEAAAEAGMDDPETYRKFRETERKAKAYEAEQQRIADEKTEAERSSFVEAKLKQWQGEAETLKASDPNFNFDADMANPQFLSMLRAGVSVEAAYQALHHSEIVARQVESAKSETEKAVIDNLRAKGQRPVEGGANSTSAPLTGFDVRTLTKEQRADLARQAALGKRIEFK